MFKNDLLVRNLFELSQNSDEQTFLNEKAEFMRLRGEPNLSVKIFSSPLVSVRFKRFLDNISFVFYEKRSPERFDLENYASKTVEFETESFDTKRSIVLHENPKQLGEYECVHESMEEFLEFVTYLHNLFDARVNSLEIKGDQAHHLARLYSIEKFRRSGDVSIFGGTLSKEEMRQVLKFRNVSISSCVEPGFELEEPISMEAFYTNNAHWFKGPMLMQLDCRKVQVHSLELQNAHVNAFLHHWMRSSDRKLRSMQLFKNCRDFESFDLFNNCWDAKKNWDKEKFDLLKIAEGLANIEKPNALDDSENYLSIRRPTDGMVMTVHVWDRTEWMSTCYLYAKCKS